jgi:hypothetical protein
MMDPGNRPSRPLCGLRHCGHNRSGLLVHNDRARMQADDQPASLIDAASRTILVADRRGQAVNERRESSQREANPVLDPLPIGGRDLQIL